MSCGRVLLGLTAVITLLAALLPASCGKSKSARFPHSAHLRAADCGGEGQSACPTCFSCHNGVRHGGAALPAAKDCAGCHPKDVADRREKVANVQPIHPDRTPIVFPHVKHLKMKKIRGQCVRCHKGVVSDGAKAPAHPPMATCTDDCHAQNLVDGVCNNCHRNRDLAKLMPRDFLRHDLAFVRRGHGDQATRFSKVCQQCHVQRFCADCHDSSQTMPRQLRRPDAIERELGHRADYLSRHSIEARANSAKCATCHATSSCEACHLERGVSSAHKNARNPHPTGFAGPAGTDAFHGPIARRDVVSCAACHDQGPATNCIGCHRVGGGGGTPHPDGWSSARSTQDAMCKYCH